MLSPSVEDLLSILVEGGSICLSDWCYIFPLWTTDGFDGFIKTMRVVSVSIKLDLAGFPGPPVIFHSSEGPMDFSSDGGESSLKCCGLWIG